MTTRACLLSLLLLLAALPLLPACGGGGGAAPIVDPNPDPDPDPDPDPVPSEEALAILEGCLPNAQEALEDFIGLFLQVSTGQAGVFITDATANPPIVNMQIDPSGGEEPLVEAVLRIEDGDGNPADVGWTEQQMMDLVENGIDDLPPLLTGLDGVVVVLEAVAPGQPDVNGNLEVDYLLGLPTTMSGEVNVADGDCTTSFSFTDVRLIDLLAQPFPRALFEMSILSGEDTLLGTLEMTGAALATALMTLNGSPEMEFSVNLQTGEVLLVE